MNTIIRSWGNSQGLYLSKKLLTEAGLKVNDSVDVSVDSGMIIIRKDNSEDVRLKAWKSLQALRSTYKERQSVSSDDYRKERDEYLDEKYGK